LPFRLLSKSHSVRFIDGTRFVGCVRRRKGETKQIWMRWQAQANFYNDFAFQGPAELRVRAMAFISSLASPSHLRLDRGLIKYLCGFVLARKPSDMHQPQIFNFFWDHSAKGLRLFHPFHFNELSFLRLCGGRRRRRQRWMAVAAEHIRNCTIKITIIASEDAERDAVEK
jgi:hypothetical protein